MAPERRWMVMSRSEARKLVHELLEEEALVIGGLVALHGVEDEFVWQLFRGLDEIRGRYLARLTGEDSVDEEPVTPSHRRSRPHPAIEEFLARLRRA
jgi:hypothetical protein